MEKWSVLLSGPVAGVCLQCAEVHSEGFCESRMCVGVEVGVAEEGYGGAVVVQLEHVRVGWAASDELTAYGVDP